MSIFLTRATALALLAAPFCPIQAQEVYSATIGAVAVKVPSQSDVMVALPFKQEKAAGGNVTAVDGSVASLGADTLTEGEFNATDGIASHYLYVENEGLKGRHFDIVSNTASAVTLDAADLTGLSGANVSIRAHWTLGTLFPEGVGYFKESQAGRRVVEVIVPDLRSVGGGLAANRIFYFYEDDTEAAWREVGKPLESNLNSAVIEPGTAFVVRNNGATDLDYFFFGEVEYGPLAIPIVSATGDSIDNFVAVERPLGLTINDLQLHSSGVFGADDRLLVFSMAGGKNQAPKAYQYTGGAWQLEGDSADAGSTMIKAGQGIAVRKAAGIDGTNYWVNEWSLAQ
ncbi:hypothetical protein VDG1235_2276 [Verrucomicrobiia bacterium DG1235]|nr:hypothetical protein VDG1235_2276 [Verrucomicrobiae bacterium DG1235]